MPGRQIALDGVGIVEAVDVLEVRLVDDRQHMTGHAVEVRVELGERVHRSGRIVGVADVDELRLLRDRVEQCIEVVAQRSQRHPVHDGALLGGVDHVARERRPATHDFVAGVEDRLAEHVDAAVGTGADHNLTDIDKVALRQRFVKAVRAAIGIAVQLACGAFQRLAGGVKRPERPFVRRELDDAVETVFALAFLDRFPRLVGRQRCDARPKERTHSVRMSHTREGTVASTVPRPVIWRPRYATRRMRERAWANADLRREQAASAGPARRSLLARLLRRG